ncbi:hypothetical protein [Domibacillus iocasae]|uniref:Uncharacterized protein n=1 Tax=Domibacillus iocasae TaxID=1714016 RepID=A0A1E7DPD6_9BACI|nr:hypothetical protein [Domibacillus iocasae]OES44956.1 hypothetical protein BA724_06750 [Domibacillus iocasae]
MLIVSQREHIYVRLTGRRTRVRKGGVVDYDAAFSSMEQTDIRRAASLSEMLMVEELFLVDLIQKMQRTGLIQMKKRAIS